MGLTMSTVLYNQTKQAILMKTKYKLCLNKSAVFLYMTNETPKPEVSIMIPETPKLAHYGAHTETDIHHLKEDHRLDFQQCSQSCWGEIAF